MENQINQLADQLNELVDIPNMDESQEKIIFTIFLTLLIYAVKIFFT